MSSNKILTNVNRNLRSFSNSPARNQKHLSGSISSPLSGRKFKHSTLTTAHDMMLTTNNEKSILVTLKSRKKLLTSKVQASPETSPRANKICGLCGSTNKKLKITECCGNYICDDADQYRPFDFFSSCNRNHDRYTLCALHFVRDHKGKWQECDECKASSLSNLNKFNFEANENAKTFTCVNCEFSAESHRAFLFRTKNDYYCQKKACREAKKNAIPQLIR